MAFAAVPRPFAEPVSAPGLAVVALPEARAVTAAVTSDATVGGMSPLSSPTAVICGSRIAFHFERACWRLARSVAAWLLARSRRSPFVAQTKTVIARRPAMKRAVSWTQRRWANGLGTGTGPRRGPFEAGRAFVLPLLLIAIRPSSAVVSGSGR